MVLIAQLNVYEGVNLGKICQRKDLATWFGDITEKEKSEVQIVAESYASTTVNLATAFGFFPRKFSQKEADQGMKNRLLRKMLGMVPGDRREDMSEIWGEKLLNLEKNH